MAIADTVIVKQDYTGVSFTAGVDKNYVKLQYGQWMDDTSTADQPIYLKINSNVRNGGKASDYLIRFDRYKNPAAGLPVGSPDALLSAYLVVRVDYGAFSQTEVKTFTSGMAHLLTNGTLVDKILRGEK